MYVYKKVIDMKKLTILTLAILMCLTLACCKKEAPKQNTLHTMPPTEISQIEPEWAEIDCDIELLDEGSQPVLLKDDFDTFTLVEGSESYIRIKVTEDAKNQLCSTAASGDYSIALDGEVISSVTVDPATFNGEFTIGKDMPLEELYVLCDRFRNFY